MFCERCEGQYFILIFDTKIESVISETSKVWQLWKCLECGLYKRQVRVRVIKEDEIN